MDVPSDKEILSTVRQECPEVAFIGDLALGRMWADFSEDYYAATFIIPDTSTFRHFKAYLIAND